MTKFKNNTTGALIEALVVTANTTADNVREWMEINGDRYSDHFIEHAAGLVLKGKHSYGTNGATSKREPSITVHAGDVIIFDEEDEYSIISNENLESDFTNDEVESAPVKKKKKAASAE